MKRYGNLYDKIHTMENIRLAHKKAKKDKSHYDEVKRIDSNPEYYFKQIHYMLKNKTYILVADDYTMFQKNDKGKVREIYKLSYFPHRIVQHCLLNIMEEIFISDFISQSYASIPKRGIHKALNDLDVALTEDVESTTYCLQMDIRKFYPSVNHKINKKQYRRKIKDKDLLWLIDMLVDSLCLDDDGMKINALLSPIEERKGIAIGSLFSQYDGNFNLSVFDHWIKEDMGVKHCFRYMDDMVILSDSKEYLHGIRRKIESYLSNELKLELKDNHQVYPVDIRGIDFVGYRHFRSHILLRKTTAQELKRKMSRLLTRCESGKEMSYGEWCSVNSYKGWLRWCNGHNLYMKYIEPLEQYCKLYYLNNVKK